MCKAHFSHKDEEKMHLSFGPTPPHIDKPVYKIFLSTVTFFAFLGQQLPKY